MANFRELYHTNATALGEITFIIINGMVRRIFGAFSAISVPTIFSWKPPPLMTPLHAKRNSFDAEDVNFYSF